MWIYHQNGYVNSSEKRIVDRENELIKKGRMGYVERHNLDMPLTIWKNNKSFIQIYANNRLNFFDTDLRRKIIKKIKELNSIAPENLPEFDFIDVFFDDHIRKIERSMIEFSKKREIIKIAKKIGENSKKIISNETESLCVVHGDLICDNIVIFKNDVYFIDWEYISKGFPEIDICYFLFSVNYINYKKEKITYSTMCELCYADIYDSVLEYYSEEKDIKKMVKIATATMDLYLLRDALQTCVWNQDLGIDKLTIIYNLKNNSSMI